MTYIPWMCQTFLLCQAIDVEEGRHSVMSSWKDVRFIQDTV